jgi:hypothetical protein
MRATFAGTVAALVLAAAAVTAADFWEEKDFTSWSAQQVEKMLSDSPWAKQVTIVVGSLREEGPGGGFDGGAAGLGGGGGGQRSADPGGATFQQLRRIPVSVVWSSALPIRQALTRRRVGLDAPIPPDEQRKLSEAEPFYIVAIIGLPTRIAQSGTIDELRDRTALKPGRKERIKPGDVRVFPAGERSVGLEFQFPKSAAIALEDKDVEFVTKMGEVDITKKFKLADMMVRGRLAL